MRQYLEDAFAIADKFCCGSKIARNICAIVLLGMFVLLFLLNNEVCQEGIKQLVIGSYSSGMIPFYGLLTLHYGLALVLYVISISIILILVTILIAWSARKWKQRKERNAVLNEIIRERQASV